MKRRKLWIRRLLWWLGIGLGGYLLAHGFLVFRAHPGTIGKKLLGQAYTVICREAIAWYLPGQEYQEGKSPVFPENLWARLEDWSPFLTCLKQEQKEEPLVEDDTTLQELIAREQQVVTETETPEPSRELPAWTAAAEATPVKDLSLERLEDFQYLVNNFFVVDPNTSIDSSQMDADRLLQDPMALQEDGETENGEPQILIYHTHSQEGYADSTEGDPSTSVVGVGDYLTSLLQEVYGYRVLHLKDTFDLVDGQIERSKAYNYALPAVEQALAEHPSIQVVIDLHRDGVPENRHLVTEINGKPTAQIMYFNGLSRTVKSGNLDRLPNPYILDNLAFAFQLSYQAARYYPQLTRCIYLKGYRYNLHVRPRSILLEVGAQTNTVEEAMNAMEPFCVILNKVLRPEK